MKKICLSVDGMTCSACSNGLEKYLIKQDGIKEAFVNLVLANVSITYDEEKLDIDKIETFISKAGFESLGEFKEISNNKNKSEKRKFIIYSILAVLLMYISMGHMINLPTIPFLDPRHFSLNYMFTLLFLTILFIIYGFDILRNGYKNLIHKTPNMDTLVSIGVITSFLYSLYNMYLVINGNTSLIMNLYFESSSIVIYFIKMGRFIDGISKDKTKEAIQKLVSITPQKATIKVNGELREVTLDEIKKGDIVVCKAGEKVAVDGEILAGSSHLDESFITGESKPVMKTNGSKVIAGSLNYDGYIEYKAERIGKESTISEIVKLVVEATNTKAPIAKIADIVSGYFVPFVIIIAIITFIVYLILGNNLDESIITFVTVLVVACPCSLGLATPLAIIVSEGLCATNGILVKKSEILEIASKTNVVVFDKTGTLTYGKLKISEFVNFSNMKDDEILQMVGSLESKTTHPIANAFKNYMEDKKISMKEVNGFKNVAGYGITGKVDNKEIILGNSKIIEKYKIENKYNDEEVLLAKKGNSVIYVVIDKKIVALIGVNDIVREEAKSVIKELSNMKIETIMLTGDNEATAKSIANELGIKKVIANVLPKDKANIVKELKRENNLVMMCGDGINDSPALATADIGVSVNSGTDIAADSSSVILTQNNLNSIIALIKISKRTIGIIKQNLFWAFFYNTLMIPIAMGLFKCVGITINPMIASLAMVLSSITVIINTLRLKQKKYLK
ncbi:MAG: heavy metal translocating P-type ATPase [Bacilli bacterium]|nr:heavy metal translocating P-type ATPase [Bacilli bacterium]